MADRQVWELERGNDPEPEFLYAHHGFEDLAASVSVGCHLCTIVFHAHFPAGRCWLLEAVQADEQLTSYGQFAIRTLRGIFSLHFFLGFSGRSIEKVVDVKIHLTQYERVHRMNDTDSLQSDVQHDAPASGLGFSSTTWDRLKLQLLFASNNIKDCLESHSVCQNTSTKDERLPRRLVDVSKILLSDIESKVHLKNTDRLPPRTPYVTLSHRWGSSIPLQTTETTLSSFMCDGILLASLPSTFRDAVIATHIMGFSYLWIDSLCIIQDSSSADWSLEIAHMDNIYGNAVCNLADSDSLDSNGGLFRDVYRITSEPCKVYPQWNHHEMDKNGPYYAFDRFGWQKEVTDAPLNLRAWVLQERMLSPRTLHFGRSQIYWECRMLSVGHNVPELVVETTSYEQDLRTKTRLYEVDDQHLLHFWRYIIQHYSRCGLTKRSDKLAAVQGIAHSIQKRLPEDLKPYYWGVWEGDLPFGLLWFSHQGREDGTSDDRNIEFPSWSWASVSNPIVYDGHFPACLDETWQALAKVSRPLSEASHVPYGGMCLHLHGKLVRLALDWTIGSPAVTFPSLALTLDGTFWSDEQLSSLRTDHEPCRVMYWMPLLKRKDPPNPVSVYGIMMVPSSTTLTEFRRIGVQTLGAEWENPERMKESARILEAINLMESSTISLI